MMLAASCTASACCLAGVLVPAAAVTAPLVMVRAVVGSGMVTALMVIGAADCEAPMAMVP